LEQGVKKLLLEIPEVDNLFNLKSKTNVLAGDELGDVKSSYQEGSSKTSYAILESFASNFLSNKKY
jgi:hypothetical protein